MKLFFKFYFVILFILSLSTTGRVYSATFTNADLTGTFQMVNLDIGDSWGSASIYSTAVFDGLGNYTIQGNYSETSVGANLAFTDSGSYSVNNNGTFSFNNSDPSTLDSMLSSDGSFFIYTNIRETGERGIGIGVKLITASSIAPVLMLLIN